jgi:hypothetical protein
MAYPELTLKNNNCCEIIPFIPQQSLNSIVFRFAFWASTRLGFIFSVISPYRIDRMTAEPQQVGGRLPTPSISKGHAATARQQPDSTNRTALETAFFVRAAPRLFTNSGFCGTLGVIKL